MHLLVDISAHGLGHLAQTAPVIEAIKTRQPGLQLTIRSALQRQQLARRIAADFEHVMEARDFGFVMHNAVDIDLDASARAYRDFHDNWQERVSAEAAWLQSNRVNAVITNVAYLPLAAAANVGIPAVSFCSLNWADLFFHYFAAEPWAKVIHIEIFEAYTKAACFLRVTPGLPMANFSHALDIGSIACVGRRDRGGLSQQLGIDKDSRWVLLAMGGMEFRLPIESWKPVPGVTWLVPSAWQIQRQDVRTFDNSDIAFADILASVDAVVTKPGYGMFAEAACSGIPIVYLQRDDWPETKYLSAWLSTHSRSRQVSRVQMVAGEFIDDLLQLWQEPSPAPPVATGVHDAIGVLVRSLGLDATAPDL